MFSGFTVMFVLGMIVVMIFGIASLATNSGKEKGRVSSKGFYSKHR